MWIVTIVWDHDRSEEREFKDTRELKLFLDGEALCLKHGCPLPLAVMIERSEGDG